MAGRPVRFFGVVAVVVVPEAGQGPAAALYVSYVTSSDSMTMSASTAIRGILLLCLWVCALLPGPLAVGCGLSAERTGQRTAIWPFSVLRLLCHMNSEAFGSVDPRHRDGR